MTNDWIMRVGDGVNFRNSSDDHIWGIRSKNVMFLSSVQQGDRLWFVANGGQGQVIAVATYRVHNRRDLGPLINLTKTNAEFGWDNIGPNCDMEIHYTGLYNLTETELYTHIKGQTSVRRFANNGACAVNLPVEYDYIVRYSRVSRNM